MHHNLNTIAKTPQPFRSLPLSSALTRIPEVIPLPRQSPNLSGPSRRRLLRRNLCEQPCEVMREVPHQITTGLEKQTVVRMLHQCRMVPGGEMRDQITESILSDAIVVGVGVHIMRQRHE